MTGRIYNREYTCNHCGNIYCPKRSDQRFCSTSHRVAYYQWKQRQKKVTSTVEKAKEPSLGSLTEIAKPTDARVLLKAAAMNALISALDHGILKAAGMHNHDLKKQNEAILKNQHFIIDKLNNLDKENLKVLQALLRKEQEDRTWMHNLG